MLAFRGGISITIIIVWMIINDSSHGDLSDSEISTHWLKIPVES